MRASHINYVDHAILSMLLAVRTGFAALGMEIRPLRAGLM